MFEYRGSWSHGIEENNVVESCANQCSVFTANADYTGFTAYYAGGVLYCYCHFTDGKLNSATCTFSSCWVYHDFTAIGRIDGVFSDDQDRKCYANNAYTASTMSTNLFYSFLFVHFANFTNS